LIIRNYSQTLLCDKWYKSPENQASSLFRFDRGDAARWAIVKKYGGIYSDLDIIYFKKPNIMETTNKVGAQYDFDGLHYLNGNFLDFERGHPFVDRAINDFVIRYRPDHDWGAPGPELITYSLKQCLREGVLYCQNIEIMLPDRLQSIRPGGLRENLNKNFKDNIQLRDRILEVGLGLHFSNSEIKSDPFKRDSIFHNLFTYFCPSTAEQYDSSLFVWQKAQ